MIKTVYLRACLIIRRILYKMCPEVEKYSMSIIQLIEELHTLQGELDYLSVQYNWMHHKVKRLEKGARYGAGLN